MANITRIKANDSKKPKPKPQSKTKVVHKTSVAKPQKGTKTTGKSTNNTTDKSTVNTTDASTVKTSPKNLKAAKQATDKPSAKQAKDKSKKPMSKPVAIITWPFRMIAKPFIALGRYIKESWHEIRQVRWPNRKTTWKMTGAILAYSALVMAFILLLDALFTFIFNNILGS